MSAFMGCDKYEISVQPGHIIVNSTIKDVNLLGKLKSFFNTVNLRDLGDYDFILPNNKIVYISERKLLMDVDTLKLKSLCNPLVIADRNTVTVDVFFKLQNILQANNIPLFPVGHSGELPLLLHQINAVYDSGSQGSSFRQDRDNPPDIQEQILLNVPGLGRVKAISLLKKFKTVQKVAFAKLDELASVIGTSSASQVYRYFNSPDNS